nr:lipopolysaccharide-induced tumor necrosis factor-alpha factor homolog [Cherax quadricarinatus]
MSKASAPPSAPPPYAPPSYSQAVGGVPPQAPFIPFHVVLTISQEADRYTATQHNNTGSEGRLTPTAPPPPHFGYLAPSSFPDIGGPKGSLIAPLTAPNTPTSFPLDSSFHEAIRQRLFNTGAPTAVVTTVVPLGSQSTHMICPHCHAEVDTATKTSPSMVAWLSGFIICILGCWMGCCLIPCCINDCMNVEHNCPNCQAFLGKYKRG